ncbi:MAG: putative histidine kinase [Rhodocyclales bacterium]|nr:putative histidine kinase [Rhodocyclales bacterium]
MAQEVPAEDAAFLATLSTRPREKKWALGIIAISALCFILAAPYAKLPLPKVWAFIPIYESALVTNDLITAALLFGQFKILGSRSLCVLACGYLFTACIAVVHALTFPGLFAPAGLLGAGPQTTAWLYMFWHGGFPLFVIAYAFLKSENGSWRASDKRPLNAAVCAAATILLVALFAVVASLGREALPAIMQGNHYTPVMSGIVGSVWLLSLISVVMLYLRRPHSVLDLWLGVVMCAWLFDIALSAVLNAGRFDLGFYAGRIYGLVAASGVLLVLLLENGRLYARLAEAHQSEHRKSSELAAVNKELEAFSYSVSHDLRAPLRAIDGFSKALLNRLGPHSDNSERHYLDRIRTAAQRMGALIDDLINLSRITRAPLRAEQVDMTKMSRDILAELADAEPARKVTCSVGEGLVVNADPHLLAVLLRNLLGNAWKYTSRNAEAMIELGVNRVDGTQVFYVKDNGVGFDMTHAKNLFTPFHRLHTDAEFPGTGIGLATVHRVVCRHSGSIRAEAEPARGATFHFALEKS